MGGGGIPQFFVPNIHPQVVDQGGAPDPLALLLQGFQQGLPLGEAGYKESQQNSRSSAENDIRKQELAVQQQHFKLLQEEERTKQAHLAHQQEITNQVGTGYNAFLEHLLPHAAATGQLGQMLGGQQQQAPQQQGIPQNLPWQQAQGQISGLPQQPQSPLAPAPQSTPSPLAAPQGPGAGPPRTTDPFEALAQILPSMSPEAVPILMQHIAPIIGQFQKGGPNGSNALEQADTGKYKTVFDKTKGYWNPDTKQWQPELPKGYTTEELAKQANDRQDRQDRQVALDDYRSQMKDYRDQLLVTGQKRDFMRQVKPITDRAPVLQQALLTLKSAADTSDPAMQKTLRTSAVINLIQAADQKANVRSQIVSYFNDNIDASIGGKWEVLKTRLLNGTMPQYSLNAMIQHVGALNALTQSEYDRQRSAEIKRHPNLAGWLPEADEIWGGSSQQPQAGGSLDQFIPPPPPHP